MLTRRLWLGIGLHGTWNYTMGRVFSVSGVAAEGLIKASFEGPERLTATPQASPASSISPKPIAPSSSQKTTASKLTLNLVRLYKALGRGCQD